MAERKFGTCTECGEEDVELTVIDKDTRVCDDCLTLDFVECDECQTWFAFDSQKIYHLMDGRTLCERCAKKMMEEGEFTEADIEEIEDYVD